MSRRAHASACWPVAADDYSTVVQVSEMAARTGRLNRNGYGRVCFNGREPVVHRLVYELLVGMIPTEYVLDHLCRNRRCCNPEHLEPVTMRENTIRGEAVLYDRR